MASWTLAAWLLHRALFHFPGDYLLISKEERSAEELLMRVRHLVIRLPKWMHIQWRATRRELRFPDKQSRIFTLPATPEAVRLFTPTAVVWDEMAFTHNAEQMWTALSPALDSSARFIGISTPNGRFSLFGRLVQDAGKYGFALHEIHYTARPDRGENWRKEKRKELSDAEWRREYELSLEESNGLRVIESFTPAIHVLPQSLTLSEIKNSVRLFRAIDFGYRTPALLWIAEISDKKYVVFDEWVGDNVSREVLFEAICAGNAKWEIKEEDFQWTACDPAGAQQSDAGIPMVDYLSGLGVKLLFRKSRIEDGLDLLRVLFRTADGKSRLFITSNCTRLRLDLESYTYDERTGKPVKGIHDHTVDALRYFVVCNIAPEPVRHSSRIAGTKRT